ncbi:hypothetical protein HDU78_003126 [Chytriomyces hyalinus]|nr:hypothetical protein HDU78_003126 [Chytriomyces hyalinus]
MVFSWDDELASIIVRAAPIIGKSADSFNRHPIIWKWRFIAHFGLRVDSAVDVWEIVLELFVAACLKNECFLCALYFLKVYPTEATAVSKFSTSETNWRVKVKLAIDCFQEMDEIHFDDCFENWDLEQPSCYVNGTDVLVTETCPQDAALFSHKFNHAGYRYQVATALGCSKIVWVGGGVPCGSWPDLRMVRHGILHEIGPNEKVAADQGYRGDDQIMTKLQGRDADIRDHNHNLKQLGARHETVNACL